MIRYNANTWLRNVKLAYSANDYYSLKSVLGLAIEYIYPPRLCRSLNKPGSYWAQVFFEDELCKTVARDQVIQTAG